MSAVKRELLEETGYASERVVATGQLAANPASQTNLVHCFLALGVEKVAESAPGPTERLQTELVPLPEVIELARSGGLLQALHVGSLFLAMQALDQRG